MDVRFLIQEEIYADQIECSVSGYYDLQSDLCAYKPIAMLCVVGEPGYGSVWAKYRINLSNR